VCVRVYVCAQGTDSVLLQSIQIGSAYTFVCVCMYVLMCACVCARACVYTRNCFTFAAMPNYFCRASIAFCIVCVFCVLMCLCVLVHVCLVVCTRGVYRFYFLLLCVCVSVSVCVSVPVGLHRRLAVRLRSCIRVCESV